MNSRTHRNLAKMFMPHVPYKKIDKVNSAIDNPSKQMVAIQNSGFFSNEMVDAFGLKKHGHRKYNHTPASAFMSAYMVDPENAFEHSMLHLTLDKYSNYLIDNLGIDNKEMAEAMINKTCSLYREHVLGIAPRRKKKMFF